MNTKLVLIGADPEVFVSQGCNIVHCIDLLGGSKDAPFVVQGGALQEDNVLFEFNVDPTADPVMFLSHIRDVMAQGESILFMSALRLTPKVSSHVYNPEVMASFPEKAFEFGCTPDYNAYGGGINPSPTAVNECLRTAGGHVLSTSGSKADVYPVLFFAKDAYGIVPLKGKTSIVPTVLNPGQASKSDPLGQRGYVGWKAMQTCVILNNAFMVRAEVAASVL